MVTYFSPAFDGYEGFIDYFGDSVIGEPTHEQYQYLVDKWVRKDPNSGYVISELSEEDIRLGAKIYVMVKRREGLTGDLLEEEIRMNPCTVQEMFEAANTDCAFNSFNINQRKKQLEDDPPYVRKVWFYRKDDQSVAWRDIQDSEKNFHWEMRAFPPPGQENKSELVGKLRKPARTLDGAITVDSYSNSQGGRRYGSKACAWIGRRYDITDPLNTGKPIGRLFGRPSEKDILHNQVLLAAEFFGYEVYYEHTADDYLGFFKERGKIHYLGLYPMNLIDPDKKDTMERYRGTPITPYSLTKQMDLGISFFEHHCDLIDWISLLDNALIFDPYNRTAYDEVVSFLILIAVLSDYGGGYKKRKMPIMPVYGRPEFSES